MNGQTRRSGHGGVMIVLVWLVAVLIGTVAVGSPGGARMVERVDGSLRYAAAIPRQQFDPGEAVEVTIAVKNVGGGPAAITFPSGQRYDLAVRRPRGDEVWRWSHDKAFIQVIQTVTLKPGEALSFKVAWDQRDLQGRRVDPGTYEVIAIITGRGDGAGRPSVQLPPLQFTVTTR